MPAPSPAPFRVRTAVPADISRPCRQARPTLRDALSVLAVAARVRGREQHHRLAGNGGWSDDDHHLGAERRRLAEEAAPREHRGGEEHQPGHEAPLALPLLGDVFFEFVPVEVPKPARMRMRM